MAVVDHGVLRGDSKTGSQMRCNKYDLPKGHAQPRLILVRVELVIPKGGWPGRPLRRREVFNACVQPCCFRDEQDLVELIEAFLLPL